MKQTAHPLLGQMTIEDWKIMMKSEHRYLMMYFNAQETLKNDKYLNILFWVNRNHKRCKFQ